MREPKLLRRSSKRIKNRSKKLSQIRTRITLLWLEVGGFSLLKSILQIRNYPNFPHVYQDICSQGHNIHLFFSFFLRASAMAFKIETIRVATLNIFHFSHFSPMSRPPNPGNFVLQHSIFSDFFVLECHNTESVNRLLHYFIVWFARVLLYLLDHDHVSFKINKNYLIPNIIPKLTNSKHK